MPINNHVQAVVDALQPALRLAEAQDGDRVSTAIDANVRYAVKTLQASEPVLRVPVPRESPYRRGAL